MIKSGSDAIVIAQFGESGFNMLTSVVGQIYTREMGLVVEKLQGGDSAGATAQWGEIADGAALLAEGGALLASIKHVLRGRGAPAGHCCLPLGGVTTEQVRFSTVSRPFV